jgi:L-alanine-DL-glutamate epimerase-like enolase superfamily enzyme
MHWFHKDRVAPVQGQVTTPEIPGLGIEWDASSILRRNEVFA